ncbi:hypothetical protein KRM28CT15_07220 [Krasilnikovia sp. M28-CT-15]
MHRPGFRQGRSREGGCPHRPGAGGRPGLPGQPGQRGDAHFGTHDDLQVLDRAGAEHGPVGGHEARRLGAGHRRAFDDARGSGERAQICSGSRLVPSDPCRPDRGSREPGGDQRETDRQHQQRRRTSVP